LPESPGSDAQALELAERSIPVDAVLGILTQTGAFCTGTAVGRTTVLTAAHCLPAAAVVLGTDMERPQQVFNVVASLLPDFMPLDVALLRVDRNLPVDPVALRNPDDGDESPGDLLVSIGFGARDSLGQRGAGRIRQQELLAMGWRCDRESEAAQSGCLPGWEMVIPGGGGIDTCDGDSGGPLFELHEVGSLAQRITVRLVPSGARDATVEVRNDSALTATAADAYADPAELGDFAARLNDANTELVAEGTYSADDFAGLNSEGDTPVEVVLPMCSWRQTAVVSRPVANATRRCGDGGVYVRTDRIFPWVRAVLQLWEDQR
jgi:hypothetical protein